MDCRQSLVTDFSKTYLTAGNYQYTIPTTHTPKGSVTPTE